MDGFSFAKDGERPDGLDPLSPLNRSHEQVGPFLPPALNNSANADSGQGLPHWVLDHEALASWIRSIPPSQRAEFLARVTANIDAIRSSQSGFLEPGADEALLSYAILIEYAQHLGVSPLELCWTFEHTDVESVDSLLSLRVDRMLTEASHRRSTPRPIPSRKRPGEDSRTQRGLRAIKGPRFSSRAGSRVRRPESSEDRPSFRMGPGSPPPPPPPVPSQNPPSNNPGSGPNARHAPWR